MASKTASTAPIAWGSDAVVLDGPDVTDKAELIGVPFIITGIKATIGSRDIAYVYVEGERQDGTTFTFNDSSGTGVRGQLDQYAVETGLDTPLDTWVDVRMLVPNGLRLSTFDVQDERGRVKQAKTYYLTTSGKRRA